MPDAAPPSVTDRVLRALRSRRVLVVAVLLAVGLRAPALSLGLLADDWAQRWVLEHAGDPDFDAGALGPWSLYDFGAAPAPGAPLYEAGAWPWWTSPDLEVRFLRPLASLSLRLDHALFGDAHAAGHALQLALFGLLVVLLARWLRAWALPPAAVGLAALLVATDSASVAPVAWFANRNSLLEALFGAGALLALGPLRTSPSGARVALALALAAGASMCKESGVAFLFLVPVVVALGCRDASPAARRPALRLAAAGAAALVVAYAVVHVAGGYGATSRFYPTPWDAPLAVAGRGARLVGLGALASWTPFPPDAAFVEPSLAWPLALTGLALSAVAGVALFRGLPSHPATRPLLAVAALTLLPQASAPPSDRLLLVPGLALAGLLGYGITEGLARGRHAAWIVGGLALPVSAVLVVPNVATLAGIADEARATVADTARAVARTGATEVLALNAPTPFVALSPYPAWVLAGHDPGVRLWPLRMGRDGARVERVDHDTLVVESRGAPFASAPFEAVFRSRGDRIVPGRRFRTAAFEVEVLEAEGDGARTVALHLDDPDRVALVRWTEGRCEPVPLPAVGEAVEVPDARSRLPFTP